MRWLLIVLLVVAGCKTLEITVAKKETAIASCKDICESNLANRRDFSNSTCLSEDVANGWVCEVKGRGEDSRACESKKRFVVLDSSCEIYMTS